MVVYQTMLYRAVFIDFEYGWDSGEEIFASNIYLSPTDAMQEFNFTDPPFNNWFGTMRNLLTILNSYKITHFHG